MDFLQQHFGSSAEWYFAIVSGTDNRPANPNRIRKSSGLETTFDRDLTEANEIEAGILQMADDVWQWCESRQAFGRTVTVTVKIKYGDFKQITRQRSPIASYENRRKSAIDLVRTAFPPARGIRLVGVTVSNFVEAETKNGAAEIELPIFVENQAA